MDVPVPQLILQCVQLDQLSYDQSANLPIPSNLSHGEQNRENLVAQIVDTPARQSFAAVVQTPVFNTLASTASWASFASLLPALAEDRLLCGVLQLLGLTLADEEHHVQNLGAQIVDMPAQPVHHEKQDFENLIAQIDNLP
eukprot:3892320-Amphidinium_carterae.1